MSGRILQNREGGKCLREIIVDRENGAKAFVLFELTKGNIAEIKDRYILGQLRSAIDSPWSTALPDGIRSALTRSVSEEMEDRFLLENMDKDTDRSVRSAIRSALIKVKGQHGVKNGPGPMHTAMPMSSIMPTRRLSRDSVMVRASCSMKSKSPKDTELFQVRNGQATFRESAGNGSTTSSPSSCWRIRPGNS